MKFLRKRLVSVLFDFCCCLFNTFSWRCSSRQWNNMRCLQMATVQVIRGWYTIAIHPVATRIIHRIRVLLYRTTQKQKMGAKPTSQATNTSYMYIVHNTKAISSPCVRSLYENNFYSTSTRTRVYVLYTLHMLSIIQ